MELTEQIEVLNKRLIDHYGIDTMTGQPIWRIVFSDDQFENRLTDCTEEGLLLLTPVMKLLPKYKQWIHSKYVLERLVVVPDFQANELATKLSYEPIYVYEDKNENYLPPKWEPTKFQIDLILAIQHRTNKGLKRYFDPDNSQEAAIENRRKRIDNIIEELYGEDSALAGTTKTGETIIVPRNYGDNK